MQACHQKCCHIKLWRLIKVSSASRAFNIICILFYCGMYIMAIDVVTWRIIKKGAFDLFTCVIFSGCQLAHYCIISSKVTPVVTQLFKFHIYIFKIEIRNTKMYLPEVSVSSTMVYVLFNSCFWPVPTCECLGERSDSQAGKYTAFCLRSQFVGVVWKNN